MALLLRGGHVLDGATGALGAPVPSVAATEIRVAVPTSTVTPSTRTSIRSSTEDGEAEPPCCAWAVVAAAQQAAVQMRTAAPTRLAECAVFGLVLKRSPPRPSLAVGAAEDKGAGRSAPDPLRTSAPDGGDPAPEMRNRHRRHQPSPFSRRTGGRLPEACDGRL